MNRPSFDTVLKWAFETPPETKPEPTPVTYPEYVTNSTVPVVEMAEYSAPDTTVDLPPIYRTTATRKDLYDEDGRPCEALWNRYCELLLGWIQAVKPEELPAAPFEFSPGVTVLNGAALLKRLQAEARVGIKHPRYRTGALIADIQAVGFVMGETLPIQNIEEEFI